MAILYGIKKVVITELDPTTELPKTTSPKTATITTASECEMEPVTAEGAEEVLRTDDKILAVVDVDELPYGYDITLTDNTMNTEAVGIIGGFVVGSGTSGDDKGLIMPMMNDGNTAKLFKLDIYVANYKGSSITNYCKITYNKCKGKAPKMKIGKEFYAPELEIKAREATKGSKPCMEMEFVDQLPS